MWTRFSQWMDAHADPDWRNAHRLHSIQITVFWGIVSGLYVALPAFSYYMHPVVFAALCVAFAVAIALARFTKQPGVD